MSESRVTSGSDFWSWRGTMYHAAARLSLEAIYDVARMTFLEMVCAGTTTVGEFHYLHNKPDGSPYDDPNVAARQIIAAAQSVGLRLVLLRSAYIRSGYGLRADPGQARFFETGKDFLSSMQDLANDPAFAGCRTVRFGIAPHSIRAVPLEDLQQITSWARQHDLPVHMHISEQLAENEACVREYGATPVALLAREQLLSDRFTAIHAIHITEAETDQMAAAGANICSCPTTERNLGDGILDAERMMREGIAVCLGSDSQAQIAPLEDARQLDYHLRLERQQRAILDQIDGRALATRLLACATKNGAEALSVTAGELEPGSFADFITVDRKDISIAGHTAEDLLPLLVFSLDRSAIRDVVVHGKFVLRDGKHPQQEEIVQRYVDLHQQVWDQREERP